MHGARNLESTGQCVMRLSDLKWTLTGQMLLLAYTNSVNQRSER